jgi:hypothetical protein
MYQDSIERNYGRPVVAMNGPFASGFTGDAPPDTLLLALQKRADHLLERLQGIAGEVEGIADSILGSVPQNPNENNLCRPPVSGKMDGLMQAMGEFDRLLDTLANTVRRLHQL